MWNYPSRVQLDISLVSYRVEHSKGNSILTCAHVISFCGRHWCLQLVPRNFVGGLRVVYLSLDSSSPFQSLLKFFVRTPQSP